VKLLRQSSQVVCLLFGLAIGGCYSPKTLVFVNLPELRQPKPNVQKLGGKKPAAGGVETPAKKTIPGLPSKVVANEMRTKQDELRRKLDRESNLAIEVISAKLKEFYQKEIDIFYEEEVGKLGLTSNALTERFKAQTRVIFDRFAIRRAPLVSRLAFLVDFPFPKQLVPIDEEGISAKERKKRIEVRDLQRSISALDDEYEKEKRELEEGLRSELGAQAEKFSEAFDRKQDEIAQRARQEASRQVRRFGETITLQLFPDTAERLPVVPGHSATITTTRASGTSVSSSPEVTFTDETSISATAIRENELRLWLNLQRYELTEPGPGVKDVTEEFLKWRREISRSNLGK
jgi:hypothetical protein